MSNAIPSDENWLVDDDAEAAALQVPQEQRSWRVLIVDDDPDIHAVTRLALRNVTFKERGLELLSAYSGDQGYTLMRDNPDIALVLLDVVMEAEDAGLKLTRRIRGELNNQIVRIVLRTGQPGQAPEQSVIVEYDINDYKAKTELTTQKLFTTVIASLRAYEALLMLERSRIGLGKILEGASNLYQIHSLREFASGVLNQVSAVLDVGAEGALCMLQAGVDGASPEPKVMAATGCYAALADSECLPSDHPVKPALERAFLEKRNQYEHPLDVLYIGTPHGHEFGILISPPWPLNQVQRDLMGVFCHRIAAAFDNLYLFDQLQRAQESTVAALADLAEFRDEGTGGHVRRVQTLTQTIAQALNQQGIYPEELSPQLLEMVGIASILHDVGKVSTPDHVLLKPGVHTPEEKLIMQAHARIGQAILERAATMVDGVSYLTFGAQIAGGHHEHFDGSGYPKQLSGKQIPLAARIVAVVDVFDALLHRRPYKEPWSFPAVVDYIRERRGKQFDPMIVDVLFDIVENDPASWIGSDE